MDKNKKRNKSKQHKINKSKQNNNVGKTIKYDNIHKKKFNNRMVVIILLCIITILLLKLSIHFNVINLSSNFTFDISLKQIFHDFFNNDYVINILCTIITAVALYAIQIKYSKYKLKRDFRCKEIICDLYDGIEITYELREKAGTSEMGNRTQ